MAKKERDFKLKSEFKDARKEISELVPTFIILVIVTIGFLWVGGVFEPKGNRPEIAKEICLNNSLMFGELKSDGSVICKTNNTFYGEHYNMTAPAFEIKIDVDWEHYGVGK